MHFILNIYSTKMSFLVQIEVKLVGDVFEVELPNGHGVQFPNREGIDIVSYIKITGDIKLTSIKIC